MGYVIECIKSKVSLQALDHINLKYSINIPYFYYGTNGRRSKLVIFFPCALLDW